MGWTQYSSDGTLKSGTPPADVASVLAFQVSGYKFSGGASSSYVLGNDSSDSEASPISSGSVLYSTAWWRLLASNYSRTGKTTKLTLVSTVTTNATVPNSDVKIELYPITAVAGGANAMTATFGTVSMSQTYTNATLTASLSNYNTSTITLPSDGLYAVIMSFVSAQAANSMVKADVQLLISYVNS